MMRVALLTYSTRPRGGVVHTLALAEALVSLGVNVDVWSLSRGGDTGFFRSVDPAVGIRLISFPDVADESVGERIMRSIEVMSAGFVAAQGVSSYDVVHAQDCISANAVPDCIRTVHHLDEFTTPELVRCHDRAVARPSRLICVSEAVAVEVEHDFGRQAEVIANGVDAHRFAAAAGDYPPAVSDRKRWRDDLGPMVLNVGGIEPRKGTADLVEAMALVQRQRPELTLVIAGGETLFDYRPYRERVFARADELGVRLVNLGPVEHEALPSLVAAADVFAFPSTKEGFGLAALEAMAAGVPVVARDLPVLREILGTAACFAADSAGMATALVAAAAGHCSDRISAGRTLAAGCSWATAATRHLGVYRDLVGARLGEVSSIIGEPHDQS